MIQMNLFETEMNPRHRNKHVATKGGWERDKLGFGCRYTFIYIKGNQQGPSKQGSRQYFVITQGKNLKER